jgi:hypothetical protein
MSCSRDLALLVFGIVLNRRGWRVRYLGANTPLPDMIQVTAQTHPSLVVLAATMPERFAAFVPELSTLAEMAPLVLAGAGATTELAQSIGARPATPTRCSRPTPEPGAITAGRRHRCGHPRPPRS